MWTSVGEIAGVEDLLRKTLLNPVPGEMSEDLHQYHRYLRNWGVRDLFESPLLDSVLEHVRRHFYQQYCDQRREKSAPWRNAGFSLGLRT